MAPISESFKIIKTEEPHKLFLVEYDQNTKIGG
jgi:hypothetical protein